MLNTVTWIQKQFGSVYFIPEYSISSMSFVDSSIDYEADNQNDWWSGSGLWHTK